MTSCPVEHTYVKSLNIYIKHTKLQNISKVILCNILEWEKNLYKYYIRDKHDLKLSGSVLLGTLFDDGYRMGLRMISIINQMWDVSWYLLPRKGG